MPENASQIIVHHYIDSSSSLKFPSMTCCIALIAVITIIVIIVLAIVVYVVVQMKNCLRLRGLASPIATSNPESVSKGNIEEVSSCGPASSHASATADDNPDINFNMQSIPLSTLRRDGTADDRCLDSSESSGGLYEVLFPSHGEGEVLREPPQKLVTFAGQVYPSTEKNSVTDSNSGMPSASGIAGPHLDTASGSLEWDYYQPRHSGSGTSVDSEVDKKRIVDVCWV